MRKFTDGKQHTWTVEVTVNALKRARDLVDVDLLSDAGLQRLSEDLLTAVDVLYAVIKPQADQLGVSDEDFGERLAGQIEPALDALYGGLEDFFRSAGRTGLATLIQLTREAINKADREATVKLTSERTSRAIQAVLKRASDQTDQQLDKLIYGSTSTEQPAA